VELWQSELGHRALAHGGAAPSAVWTTGWRRAPRRSPHEVRRHHLYLLCAPKGLPPPHQPLAELKAELTRHERPPCLHRPATLLKTAYRAVTTQTWGVTRAAPPDPLQKQGKGLDLRRRAPCPAGSSTMGT
jgi:hypothetical protein